MYLKVEETIEDPMIMQLVHDACGEKRLAIVFGRKPEQCLSNPETRDRFATALMKQVKEDYDYRGMGAEEMRCSLQTRTTNKKKERCRELPEEDGDPDAN